MSSGSSPPAPTLVGSPGRASGATVLAPAWRDLAESAGEIVAQGVVEPRRDLGIGVGQQPAQAPGAQAREDARRHLRVEVRGPEAAQGVGSVLCGGGAQPPADLEAAGVVERRSEDAGHERRRQPRQHAGHHGVVGPAHSVDSGPGVGVLERLGHPPDRTGQLLRLIGQT